jgi:hypothetical protein
MSKEQNLSPLPSSPAKDFNSLKTSLPPLPDDFLSFQPQSSFSINDVDNGADTTNVEQEQQRESYRGKGTYDNEERYNNDRYSQKRGIYHDGHYDGHYSRSGGGGGNKYHNDKYRSHGPPSYRTPKSDQQSGSQQQRQRGRWNNHTSSKVTI